MSNPLAKLRALSDEVARTIGQHPSMGFERIGLALTTTTWTDYDCTPVNVTVFAATGEGGGHYGFLRLGDNRPQVDCPVVLTQPNCDKRPHVIVGETLLDFLALGCYFGYRLADLAHYPAETVKDIEDAQDRSEDDRGEGLALLRSEFNLQPWKNVGNKLWELQEKYLDELDINE